MGQKFGYKETFLIWRLAVNKNMPIRDQKSKIWGDRSPPPPTVGFRTVSPRHHIPSTCLDNRHSTPPPAVFEQFER